MEKMTETSINHKIIKISTFLSVLTSSFDIFGMVNIGGFNFRFCQLAILPVFVLYFTAIILRQKISFPVGFKCFLIWVVFQLLFCFRSPNLKNALGYYLWLVFNMLIVLSTYYYCERAYSWKWLIKMYLLSFGIMAIIGLIQLILYACGINFYVKQIWSSRLARINGFSYEPSYYATYMLMGLATFGWLILSKKEKWISGKHINAGFLLVFISLFLSSSRMGWLMMAAFILLEVIYNLGHGIFKTGKINRKLFIIIALGTILIGMSIISVVLFLKIDLSLFIVGLGLPGHSSHSAMPRIEGLLTCIEIFLKSPIIGYSLGGVDPMIAAQQGMTYSTLDNGAAMSIMGELLVANGIIGLIPFCLYFMALVFRKCKTSKNKSIVMALRVAMVFELAILCFNQNILRPYVWWHVAVLSALLKTANARTEYYNEERN